MEFSTGCVSKIRLSKCGSWPALELRLVQFPTALVDWKNTASVRKPNVLQGIIDNLIYYGLPFSRGQDVRIRGYVVFTQAARALSGDEISAIDV